MIVLSIFISAAKSPLYGVIYNISFMYSERYFHTQFFPSSCLLVVDLPLTGLILVTILKIIDDSKKFIIYRFVF